MTLLSRSIIASSLLKVVEVLMDAQIFGVLNELVYEIVAFCEIGRV